MDSMVSSLCRELARPGLLKTESQRSHPIDEANGWKIGEGFMRLENMYLASLISASKGSWQPEIWVGDPPSETPPPISTSGPTTTNEDTISAPGPTTTTFTTLEDPGRGAQPTGYTLFCPPVVGDWVQYQRTRDSILNASLYDS